MNNISEDSINDGLINKEAIQLIWNSRKAIFKTGAVFLIIGIIIAFGLKKEYRTEIKTIVEDNNKGFQIPGVLAQLSGMAGLNLPNISDENILNPKLFNDIVSSDPFLLKIIHEKYYFESLDSTIILEDYFNKYIPLSLFEYLLEYTIKLPFKLIDHFKAESKPMAARVNNSNLISLDSKQDKNLKKLINRITINYDDRKRILTLGVTLPDRYASASIANEIISDLTKFAIDYKIEKAQKNIDFLEKQFLISKNNFVESQNNLAEFRDRNQNINTSRAKSEEERLVSEYNLKFGIYNALSQQLEQSKIKLQEVTPLFKTIEPAKIPIRKYKPNRLSIILILTFLGLIMKSCYILIKHRLIYQF